MKTNFFILLICIGFSNLQAQEVVTNRNGREITVNSDATTTTKGSIKLAGDLGGTADAPTIPALSDKVDGSGTSNYLPKFSSSKTLANSLLYEDGANGRISLGTEDPTSRFEIKYDGSLFSGSETDFHGFQILSGKTNTDYTLFMGTDKTNGLSFIQSDKWSVGTAPLALNPQGGNIGIGTATPLSVFSNIGNTNNIVGSNNATQSSSGITWGVGTAGYTAALYNSNNAVGSNGLQVKVSNTSNQTIGLEVGQNTSQNGTSTPLFNVLGNGNVGVGLNMPTAQFEVATLSGLSTIVRRGGAATQTPPNFILQKTSGASPATHGAVVSGDYVGRILFSASNGTSYPTNGTDIVGYTVGDQTATNNGGGIFFRTVPFNSTAQSVERMRIEHNGNVGIGTSVPRNNLDVVGSFGLRNIAAANGTNYGMEFNTNSNSPRIDWVYNGAYTGSFAGDADSFFRLQNSKVTTGGFRFVTVPASGTPTERMTILNSGRVGIGTTLPTNLFTVNGTHNTPTALNSEPTNATFRIDGGSNHTIDMGTLPNPPYGGYIQAHNKNATNRLPLSLNPVGGNVGIGTINPVSLLDVYTNTGSATLSIGISGTANVDQTKIDFVTKYDGSLLGTTAVNRGWQFGARGNSYPSTQTNALFATYWNGTSYIQPFTVLPTGNFGIDSINPLSKLEVNGSATNTTAFNAGSATTIDFSKSNLAYTSANAGAIVLTNIKDGGTYTLAVQGATAGTASFTSTGFTFKPVNNGVTTASKHTLYTFIVMGTNVYFYMAAGF